ncbi:MAG TPA: hypothetical protein VF789_12795 [Thermoanaerobaculia bacterium]
MSQRNRRVLTAAGLATLLFAAPVPSRAAVPWEVEGAAFVARAWSWLESLGLAPRPAAPVRRQPAVRTQEKALQGPWQGSAIDPNGGATRLFSDATTQSRQGSAIDPNGGG